MNAAAPTFSFLFADVGMRKTGHAAREVVGTDALLELPDGHQGLMYLQKFVQRRQAGIASDCCNSVPFHVIFFFHDFWLLCAPHPGTPQSIGLP